MKSVPDEKKPGVMEQIVMSLENEMNRCAENIKTAQEPEKSSLIESLSTAYKEVHRLYREANAVSMEKLIHLSEIYLTAMQDYVPEVGDE